MSITRWDPWGDMVTLRDAVDQLMRESFVRPRGFGFGTGQQGMPVDVRETEDNYIVHASLPGVKPNDVHIQVKGDTLQISGDINEQFESGPQGQQGTQTQGQHGQQSQQQMQQGQQQGQWLVRERRSGRFQRMITLPTAVQANEAHASFEDGILTVTLPKAQEARARSIPVQAGGGGRQEIETQGQTQQTSSQTSSQSSSQSSQQMSGQHEREHGKSRQS